MLAVVANECRSVCSVTPLSFARVSDALPCRRQADKGVPFRPSRELSRSGMAREAFQQIGRRLPQRTDAVAFLAVGEPKLACLKVDLRPGE